MIEEAYVSYKVSKLLKERGFNEYCPKSYSKCFDNKLEDRSISDWGKLNQYPAPTQQMAMRWLREKHNIFISIQPDFPSEQDYKLCWCWSTNILHENCISAKGYQCYIETYEKACEAALLYSLENLVAPKENNE